MLPSRTLPTALRGSAFWLAILLPAGYGPLLALGIEETTGYVFAGLVGLNLVCLLLGHDYSP